MFNCSNYPYNRYNIIPIFYIHNIYRYNILSRLGKKVIDRLFHEKRHLIELTPMISLRIGFQVPEESPTSSDNDEKTWVSDRKKMWPLELQPNHRREPIVAIRGRGRDDGRLSWYQ